jgi:hypothetical protein
MSSLSAAVRPMPSTDTELPPRVVLASMASAIVVNAIACENPAPMVPAGGGVSTSLHDVFLIGAIVVASGIVFTLMLVDIPLRTTNRPAAAAGAEEPSTAIPSFEV